MERLVSGPVVLVVLDGWGIREEVGNNGVAMAKTPVYDHLVQTYPFTQLVASGEAVGLPEGQMGNSEVGHMTIGRGNVLYQDLVRIGKDIASGAFAQNQAFVQAFAHVTNNKSTLHIVGILSPGGVHGHEEHFIATAKAAVEAGVERVVLHPFLDGRDGPKTAGIESLKMLEDFVANNPYVVIGTVMGRYYAMDRDTNWDRTEKAVQAIFYGKAEHVYDRSVSPAAIVQEQYKGEIFDEHLEPVVFGETKVNAHDGIIFTNFRRDRAKQLSLKIMEQKSEKDLCFVTITNYGSEIDAIVAYTPEAPTTTLGEAIAGAGLTQLHVAETEKFPHATYYLNGGKQDAYTGEEDVLIPSRKDIKTHDEAPEMRAKEIGDAVVERTGLFDFVFINFANPDMVGHTANQAAIVTAIETVDRELGRVVDATLGLGGALVVIADHGNAEMMVDPVTGEPHTSHTTSPVPGIVVSGKKLTMARNGGGLIDVAPTVLTLLGIDLPESMTGTSLV